MSIERAKVVVRGAVQGVGFRPFVHRLAMDLSLNGWVLNSGQGLIIEVEGGRDGLDEFLRRLDRERPPRAVVQSLEFSFLDSVGHEGFEIRHSDSGGELRAVILPDIAVCADCLREMLDPFNRRYRHPFINCTNCGPRFSIIEALPYDRDNTSMKRFAMCETCAREYNDPCDRRFHAQPIACPECGPQLELWNEAGERLAARDEALRLAADAVRAGQIVALKGIGGFQLIVDARSEEAVRRLRERKHREEKPFAVMYPSLDAMKLECRVSAMEERLLSSVESPIVLLERVRARLLPDSSHLHSSHEGEGRARHSVRAEGSQHDRRRARSDAPYLDEGQRPKMGNQLWENAHPSPPASLPVEGRGEIGDGNPETVSGVARSVAPGNPYLGVMMPYSPLHHLLMRELGFPVVATSGNLSDEPICTDEHEALERLRGIADVFLVHNRPIARQVDDSVARVLLEREQILRRARGYAPLPITLCSRYSTLDPRPVLSVGAHLKNTVALKVGNDVFISQHIGDLETVQAHAAFQRVTTDLQRLYGARPDRVVCDLHPEYLSTRLAMVTGLHCHKVQHHHAHVLSCMAENELEAPVLGVAWDGTGYGTDGTIWGGEFLLVAAGGFERVSHLKPFPLPGGEVAIKEPRRCALGLLFEMFGEEAFTSDVPPALRQMLVRGVNCPRTSSVGRLFDAVAALIGLRDRSGFEGQAAMDLEFAVQCGVEDSYPIEANEVVDWRPMIVELLADEASAGVKAAKFHNTLAEAVVLVARLAGEPKVALSGGCFQNRYLSERVVRRLREEGFRPYWHQRVPPNDGGIALGQVMAVVRKRPKESAELERLAACGES